MSVVKFDSSIDSGIDGKDSDHQKCGLSHGRV